MPVAVYRLMLSDHPECSFGLRLSFPFAVMSLGGGAAAKNTCIVFFAPDSSFGHVGHQTLLERYKWHAGTVKL